MAHRFTTLNNFRDLGYLRTAEGRPLRKKRLLRCGVPSGLSEEDKGALLKEYGLVQLVDLRAPSEIRRQPDDSMEGVAWFHGDITEGSRDNSANPENAGLAGDGAGSRERITSDYGRMIRDQEANRVLRDIFSLLLERTEGATAIHCYGGKDRTGVTVAAVLTALGVSREDIFADYLLTNEMQLLSLDVQYGQFCRDIGFQVPRDVFTPLAVADSSYLQRSYDTAEELYGSMEGFLREGVGLTEEETAELRSLYLEPIGVQAPNPGQPQPAR